MSAVISKPYHKDLAIDTTELTKTYPGNVQALNGLSFSVKSGSIFALLGPNGAGKSTAVKILTTLSRPDKGKAKVAGIDVIRNPNAVRRSIGCVSQRSGISPDATGRDNLILQGKLYGLHGRTLKERVSELLEHFHLSDAADRLSITYSGGMRRKLDIAMGLIHRPQVLFLDEPTTGLDPEARTSLWEIISRLSKEQGMTILLTTHYLEEADHLAEQLAIVNSGKVIVKGAPEGLKRKLKGDAIHIELVKSESILEDTIHQTCAQIESVHEVLIEKHSLHIWVQSGPTTLPTVLNKLEIAGIQIVSAEIAHPSLDDVYLQYTGQSLKKTQKGATLLMDLNNGVIDRFLITPVNRVSFILGKLVQQAALFVIQSLILIVLSRVIGAKFTDSIYGILIIIVSAVLLGVAMGALSIGFALITRKIDSMVSLMQFFTFPLMFLSSALMPQSLTPTWIKIVGYFNPVNWAVRAGRGAFGAHADWEVVLLNGALVFAFAIVCVLLSTQAFRAYQRSM